MKRSKNDGGAVFLVECFAPASEEDAAGRVGEACADLRAEGVDVRYLGALVVPSDELAFHVFAAPDAGSVVEAGRRARLRVERVVPALAPACASSAWSGPWRSPSNDARAVARQALPVVVEAERSAAHEPGEIGP